ncbi:CIC11C00000001197 [Sungouiella intermedia]|uniref:Protein STU1 n=1 Tax=Sungouiella intermedia TaxID=45354 RepID=A0A1L0CX91_9ASCO|nr:CIC11C00000001197 [[Candida] intermedia]
MVVSGDELYRAVIAGKSQTVTSLLADLKTHVKKDNVALPLVPKYFEALSIVMDTTDPAVQALAFSSICHLVKRVSIQDSTGKVLADQSFLVLPIVIPRIADKKSSISASARRALEAYWLSVPVKVEQALIDVGLSNRSLLIINETVVWLNHILTEINPYFKLDAFFTPLAQTLNKHASNTTLVENIKVLFANYYDLKQNKLHQFELQKVLESSGVSTVLRASIMGTDAMLSHQPQKPARSHDLDYTSPSVHSQPTYKSSKYGSRPSTSFKGESNEPSLNVNVSTINSSTGDNSTSSSNSHSDSTNGNGPANDSTSLSELEKLTAGLANYKLDIDFPSRMSPVKAPYMIYLRRCSLALNIKKQRRIGPRERRAFNSCVKSSAETLKVTDPNSQVRQSAKDAYWQYRKLLPESADELLGKLDSNVLRALERSKPADEKFTSLMTTKKSRPSLKEAIMARNKQMRAKTSETPSTSSFLPRRPNEFEESNQRSVNRIASDPLRGPSRIERGHAPHYAQSTFSHRATTQPLLEVIKSSSAPPSEIKSAPSLSPPSLHFSKNSASTLAKQSSEVLNDQAAAFEGRNDPILKFLLSSQEEFIREGVNLLRYALIGDEDISKEIKQTLRKVSISNTEMLRPLFEEGESLFKKACRLFQIDDFFRIIAILLPVSTKNLDLILSLFEVEQIYDSINTLLSYVADLDNIVDEKLLVMQIIKYKSKILDMLVQFLNKVILKMPISDLKFAKLTANLVELVPIVDSSWILQTINYFCKLSILSTNHFLLLNSRWRQTA